MLRDSKGGKGKHGFEYLVIGEFSVVNLDRVLESALLKDDGKGYG